MEKRFTEWENKENQGNRGEVRGRFDNEHHVQPRIDSLSPKVTASNRLVIARIELPRDAYQMENKW